MLLIIRLQIAILSSSYLRVMLSDCIRLERPDPDEPEDFLSASLSTIFVNDAETCFGDVDTTIIYTARQWKREYKLSVANTSGEDERRRFAHYLWNASLWAAQQIEAGAGATKRNEPSASEARSITVKATRVLELGAGAIMPVTVSTSE